ncbi:MAG TPA: DUF6249 domain-containing protein [Anaerolineae bacterium]|jgi:hypothetical protein|nr:DUF6249 domain-containing protein [Anaerolineae bacterium]
MWVQALMVFGFVLFFALLFGTLVLMRWFRHKETLAMIEQGMRPAHLVQPRNGKRPLAWGIALLAFGTALMCGGVALASGSGWGPGNMIGPAVPLIVPGLIALALGVAFIVIYLIFRTPSSEERSLEPWEVDERDRM